MTSRVIASHTITTGSNDDIVITAGASQQTLTIAAGTYFFGQDNEADDLGAALETAIKTHTQISTCAISIFGVDTTDSTVADGRLKILCDVDFDLDFDVGATFTADKRLFGYAVDDTAERSSTSNQISESRMVHLGGFYPQITADWYAAVRGSWAEVSGASATAAVEVVDWGQYERIDLEWLVVLSALVRLEAATVNARATQVNITTSDGQAPLEAFGRYLVTHPTETWRFYNDATDTATYNGDYRFPGDSSLWQDPLALSSVLSRAGEEWTARLEGIRGPL